MIVDGWKNSQKTSIDHILERKLSGLSAELRVAICATILKEADVYFR